MSETAAKLRQREVPDAGGTDSGPSRFVLEHPSHPRHAAIAFLVPVILLAPFCTKGFHIDDTHFLRMAQHLHEHPLDYFGYSIHWNGHVGPGFETNYNPPGVGYLLALMGGIFGWSEVPLHLAFAFVAGLTSLGIYRLGQRLGVQALLASLVASLMPGYIVSGSTLMSDMPALGLYVWSLYLWVGGVEDNRSSRLIAGALLMGLCAVTKYFGITAVALAAVYALWRRKKPGLWCVALAAPPLMLFLYSLHAKAVYGRNHFLFAGEFARTVRDYLDHALIERIITVVPYFGVIALPCLLLLMLRSNRSGRIALAVGLAASGVIGATAGLFAGVAAFYDVEPGRAPWYVGFAAIGGFLGLVIVVTAVREVVVRRDAASGVLALWLIGTLVYAVAVAPILGARVLLPALPAVALLCSRGIAGLCRQPTFGERLFGMAAWSLAAALAVGALVGDYVASERDRRAAQHAAQLAMAYDGPLFYTGTWGFQYYAEEGGAQPLVAQRVDGEPKEFSLVPGMLVVVPQMYGAMVMPADIAEVVEEFAFVETWPLATWDAKSRAGFYGEFLGRLPIAFDGPREHRFVIYRVRDAP